MRGLRNALNNDEQLNYIEKGRQTMEYDYDECRSVLQSDSAERGAVRAVKMLQVSSIASRGGVPC